MRIILLSLMVGSVACSDLTSVHATDIVQPDNLATPAGAETFRLGAIGKFLTAFGSVNSTFDHGFVFATGLISDEFYAGHPASIASDNDFRNWAEPTTIGPYTSLQRARIGALEAVKALQKYVPSPKSKTGHMFALVAYTETFLGEAVCSGIPLGALSDAGPVYGTPLTTAELLTRAAADFDSALVYAVDTARVLNLARVGKGRALLDNGKFAEAAVAVGAVPTNFVFNAEYTAALPDQQDVLYQWATVNRLVSVSDREGTNGLDFRSANDPRVPTAFVGKGADGTSDIYQFTKITSAASPIVLASGIEARLIEAEAQLNAGNAAGAVATLNSLRATAITPALAPLTLQATAVSQQDQVFRERAFWLFGTGHRHGDLRRLVRQYGRAAESVFPTGLARPGISYGTRMVFVPTATAGNNPAYKACANLGA
jgi:hypothetical protein